MELITENYSWIFSGVGVAIIGWIGFALLKNRSVSSKQTTNQSNSNVITINNIKETLNKNETSEYSANKRKEDFRILFIDDNHNDFKMVSILKKAGWTNTKAIKDLTDLDDQKAREASIIFVDINGVGTQMFEDQGLGLAAALKDKYPDKTIILYSAEPTGNRFDKKLRKVDDSLPKNAEPYEFISLIEQYIEISE